IFLTLLLVAADQLTKFLVERQGPPFSWRCSLIPPTGCAGPEPQVPGLGLTYVRNSGAAFGLFRNHTPVLALLSVAIALGIVIYYVWRSNRSWGPSWRYGLILVLSGAIGNAIDRLFRVNEAGQNYVVDFIDLRFPSEASGLPGRILQFLDTYPVFNFADMYVVAGLLCIALVLSFAPHRPPQPLEAPQTAVPGAERTIVTGDKLREGSM
ncbi:MAG: signal peptidase II, partial [Deinococcus sp.]|nr:signal peptidase II [Deinococcus sp.]